MEVCPLCLLCCVDSDLCEELIDSSEESYQVCVRVCAILKPKK
jgi:hypothetical protein